MRGAEGKLVGERRDVVAELLEGEEARRVRRPTVPAVLDRDDTEHLRERGHEPGPPAGRVVDRPAGAVEEDERLSALDADSS